MGTFYAKSAMTTVKVRMFSLKTTVLKLGYVGFQIWERVLTSVQQFPNFVFSCKSQLVVLIAVVLLGARYCTWYGPVEPLELLH